ncbi:DUF167 domain-containing protein [Coraliomargarita sp. W4R53]
MLLTTELDVRVIPNASRDVVVGWHAGALKVKVSAQPESGKANKAVCALLAKELKLQKRAVSVVRGATSQTKRVEIVGLSEEGVRERFPS